MRVCMHARAELLGDDESDVDDCISNTVTEVAIASEPKCRAPRHK